MLNVDGLGQGLPISRPTTRLYKKFQGHPGPKGVGLNDNGLCDPQALFWFSILGHTKGKKKQGAQQARIPSGVFRQIHCRSNQ